MTILCYCVNNVDSKKARDLSIFLETINKNISSEIRALTSTSKSRDLIKASVKSDIFVDSLNSIDMSDSDTNQESVSRIYESYHVARLREYYYIHKETNDTFDIYITRVIRTFLYYLNGNRVQER